MQMPAVDDTIVAVSSGWELAAMGIVRLSGPASFALAGGLGAASPRETRVSRPVWNEARLKLGRDGALPATVVWFHGPNSYTGQDLVELHTVGCLPLLRRLSAQLIERGARRALPGEFTARAYLLGKLEPSQAEAVLTLIHARDAAAVRQASRLSRSTERCVIEELTERLTELLARIEAGIDFVEEEDVRFVSAAEVRGAIDELLDRLNAISSGGIPEARVGKLHVALAGLPNAGKSTLFNALLGYERAIVAPVLGTTRDVLSAEVRVNDVTIVLQDCAGRGSSAAELESAAHLAAERTANQADLVLWVHEETAAWDARETRACGEIPPERRVLVRSKCDLPPRARLEPIPVEFAAVVPVSAGTGTGLAELKRVLGERVEVLGRSAVEAFSAERLAGVRARLDGARQAAEGSAGDLLAPEIVALELRGGLEGLLEATGGSLPERVLGWIFAQFCVGK